jgi:hypothetical protein
MISGCLGSGGAASPHSPPRNPPLKASDHCVWGFFCATGAVIDVILSDPAPVSREGIKVDMGAASGLNMPA